MCGIIGIFNAKNAKANVARVLHTHKGRGKDGDHMWSSGNHAIGHRLHAVVGRVHQPCVGKGVLVANCEIYNWQELAKEHHLSAKNDAHALFLLLEKKHPLKVIELLDGDYAFLYFRDGIVWCARDRVGVKPIWYEHEKHFKGA